MSLLQHPHWAAVFVPGRTAMGHHWDLVDPEAQDAPLGRTARVYKNPLFRTITLTGLDSGNDIRADVFAGDDKVAQVFSAQKDRLGHVELRDAAGTLLGGAVNDGTAKRMALRDAAGSEVGALVHEGDEPWPVTDAHGTTVAYLTRVLMPARSFSLLEDVLLDSSISNDQRDWQATFHLGIRHSSRYEVLRDEAADPPEPLRTLVGALPLLAAYGY